MLPPPGWRPQPVRPPRPEDDVTTGVFRAHWMSVPLQVVAVTLVFVALVGPILNTFGFAWVVMMAVAVVFGTLAYALPAWWYATFGLREDHLVVHSGLVRRSSREVPLSRLQAVDVVRPLFLQVFGMAELRIELAGGDGSDIRLRCLPRVLAERLRVAVLAHAAGLPGRSPEAPEWPFYRLPFLLLLGALTFRVPVLLSFIALLMLATAGAVFAEPGVVGALLPLTLGLLRYFWGPLARYTDYYASLSSDGLRLRYGMFQRRMQTVPPGRVQAVRVVEPLLWRALGVARVEANVAGYAGARQADSSTLLPVAPRRTAFALVNELFPESEAAHVPLVPNDRPVPNLMGVDEHLFVSTRGLFCLVTEIVPVERVQTARLVAGPLARLTGRVAVDVDTPPGPVRARAHGRQAREARRFLDALAEHGRRARVPAAGTERWATRATLTRRTGAAGRPSFEEVGPGEPASSGAPAHAGDTQGPTRVGAPAPAAPPPGGRPRFVAPGAEGPESEDPGPGVAETGKTGTADTSAEDGTEGTRDTPER
ncbi:PH domain-containing protein [Nocardiopsis dassonvillei]|uniref:PH domain-containing protein n=1 Tax=Nocardiopsis dassonvillei TaxID=2014 RepID=UPI003626C486